MFSREGLMEDSNEVRRGGIFLISLFLELHYFDYCLCAISNKNIIRYSRGKKDTNPYNISTMEIG